MTEQASHGDLLDVENVGVAAQAMKPLARDRRVRVEAGEAVFGRAHQALGRGDRRISQNLTLEPGDGPRHRPQSDPGRGMVGQSERDRTVEGDGARRALAVDQRQAVMKTLGR